MEKTGELWLLNTPEELWPLEEIPAELWLVTNIPVELWLLENTPVELWLLENTPALPRAANFAVVPTGEKRVVA